MLRVVVLAPRLVVVSRNGIAAVRFAGSAKRHPELRSTQASIAISADGDHWFLINASPICASN